MPQPLTTVAIPEFPREAIFEFDAHSSCMPQYLIRVGLTVRIRVEWFASMVSPERVSPRAALLTDAQAIRLGKPPQQFCNSPHPTPQSIPTTTFPHPLLNA